MNRRHTVLAAVIATLAVDCKEESVPLFEGFESLDFGPGTVEGHQTRAWMVSAGVNLPQEAEASAYGSVLHMDILFSSGEASMDAAFVVRECDDAGPVHENLAFPRMGDTESISTESIEFPGFLADCPIQECVRTLCVEATNHLDGPLALSLRLYVQLLAAVNAEDDSATIDVPIDLTLEEIEP